jgi:cell division protein FtsN
MVGTIGDFPASGYYAACNSFARNTSVEVSNLENGKSITVIITMGLENPGVFMMLSKEASDALGLKAGRISRIRASEPRSAVELAPSSGSAASFDPDLNPRLLAAEELKRLGYELAPSGNPIDTVKPASSSPRVSPAATVAPVPQTVEPAVPPRVVVETVPEAVAPLATVPATTETPIKPAALGLDDPQSATASAATVPVAEPTPLGSERPQPVTSSKPKPVRTVVLPQLPEPSAPTSTVAEAPVPVAPTPTVEPVPDAIVFVLPEPDETPIRITPSNVPRRYETPAFRPEVSAIDMEVPNLEPVTVSLSEPDPVGDARAEAYARTAPNLLDGLASADLADPSIPAMGRAEAIYLGKPSMANGAKGPELAWPELEADEIPEVVLSVLSAPMEEIPATSLAEGEIMLPAMTGPSALALETPAYGAAETSLALDDAEVEPAEKPSAETPSGVEPYMSSGSVELAEAETKPGEAPAVVGTAGTEPMISGLTAELPEAAEQKPETSPYVAEPAGEAVPQVSFDQPREYIVAIEPAGPKPPAAGETTIAPVAVAPVEKPVAAVAPVEKPATVVVPAVPASSELKKGYYYIQIGAYRSEASARDALSTISPGFAVLVQKSTEKGKDTWRVFIGPLSRDESGVALVRVRAMGYKDAFLKSGG